MSSASGVPCAAEPAPCAALVSTPAGNRKAAKSGASKGAAPHYFGALEPSSCKLGRARIHSHIPIEVNIAVVVVTVVVMAIVTVVVDVPQAAGDG